MNHSTTQTNYQTAIPAIVVNAKRETASRNESAEKSLIACELAKPELIHAVSELGIQADDFREFGHSEIQTALCNQWNRNRRINCAELVAEVSYSLGREVQPVLLLAEIFGDYQPLHNWRFFAERIAQASYARLLERNNLTFWKACKNPSNRPADIEQIRQDHETERLAMVARLGGVL